MKRIFQRHLDAGMVIFAASTETLCVMPCTESPSEGAATTEQRLEKIGKSSGA
jgi:hypothetical protein